MLNHVVISSSILLMVVLSKYGDRESCHDTSVVTYHVDHVVGFGVFIVSQVSSLHLGVNKEKRMRRDSVRQYHEWTAMEVTSGGRQRKASTLEILSAAPHFGTKSVRSMGSRLIHDP